MSVPLQVVGGAIAQVYLPLAQVARKVLALMALRWQFLIATAAERYSDDYGCDSCSRAAAFILGDQWYFAGTFLRWICPWLMLAFIASPISEVFSVLERQADKLVFNGVLL